MAQENWIIIMPKCCGIAEVSADDCEMSMISLPHPKTQKSVKFLLRNSVTRSDIFEINRHSESPSSWLMNVDSVKCDGSLLMATPFDPLFIVLANLFKESSGKFVLVEQLFPPSIGSQLLKCLKSKLDINDVANMAGEKDFIAYRYDETKALKWLEKKVENTVSALKHSKLFIEEQENVTSENSRLVYACGLVCDYLPNELALVLKKHLGITEKPSKRKSAPLGPSTKKAKTEPTEDYSKLLPKSKNDSDKKSMTRAQKCLDKVDKRGMKTMSNYFKPKTKT